MSHFSVGNYLSHSAENFREEPVKVSEKLEYRKLLCIMGWYHGFPSKVFSFTVPQNFVAEPFCVSESFLYGSKYEKEGAIMIFCQEFPVSQCRKFSWVNPLVFQKISGVEEMYKEEGVSRFSVKIFLSHITKNFVVEPFVFTKVLVWYKIFKRTGMSRFSVGNFLPHSAKNDREEPFNVSENLSHRKVLCIMGAITIFRRNFLLLQYQKVLYRKLLCFRKCLEWEKMKKITG